MRRPKTVQEAVDELGFLRSLVYTYANETESTRSIFKTPHYLKSDITRGRERQVQDPYIRMTYEQSVEEEWSPDYAYAHEPSSFYQDTWDDQAEEYRAYIEDLEQRMEDVEERMEDMEEDLKTSQEAMLKEYEELRAAIRWRAMDQHAPTTTTHEDLQDDHEEHLPRPFKTPSWTMALLLAPTYFRPLPMTTAPTKKSKLSLFQGP